ncbi:hypothetical protein AB6A40_010279 [Gnathostoma spinigerum]|uniref:Uncharacterized protein n=1 Tax=Gnathostoma spinigerum TaxID=75299 RepID=A0ABD6EUB9_9BILA
METSAIDTGWETINYNDQLIQDIVKRSMRTINNSMVGCDSPVRLVKVLKVKRKRVAGYRYLLQVLVQEIPDSNLSEKKSLSVVSFLLLCEQNYVSLHAPT